MSSLETSPARWVWRGESYVPVSDPAMGELARVEQLSGVLVHDWSGAVADACLLWLAVRAADARWSPEALWDALSASPVSEILYVEDGSAVAAAGGDA